MQLSFTFPGDESEMSNRAVSLKRTRIPSPVHIHQAGAAPKKIIVVPGRLINVVI
jgi:hypothetical protein